MASILQINFSSIESKPHLTNVFMNHARWNYQNGFETNQMTDTFPIESRTYRDSKGESGLRLTFEDFPESTSCYKLHKILPEATWYKEACAKVAIIYRCIDSSLPLL